MIFLSHVIDHSTPHYGGQGPFELNRVKCIEDGDSSNNTEITIPSHFGTHIDAPFHFDHDGQTLESYPADFWRCSNPYLLEYNAEKEEIIGLDKIQDMLNQIPIETDLLLVRTGIENERNPGLQSDYIFKGPGIEPEIGIWLRKHRKLKMIGFDFISLTSYSNRELGRNAHQAFLSNDLDDSVTSPPILIIEDMHLCKLIHTPDAVWVIPLRFQQSDGAPVTVVAEF